MTIPEVERFEDTDELPPDTPLLGGRFVIDVRIGRGGAGTVYAGTTADGRDVAIKIMSAAYAGIASSRQRFRNELALAQHLAGHPRIAVPYELGELPELGGRPYIAMPLVKGRPLLLLVGRLPAIEAVALVRDLAKVVADVHAQGIIHRDIKPGNVIVSEDRGGRAPTLLDFGLACSHGQSSAPMTVGLTAAHELPGTKHYMAPEQILGASPDPRFDVYALGVTLYEVLVGFVPLHELSPADAARRKCDASLPSLSIAGRVPGLPRELERVVDAALERDPNERTASAEQLAEALTEVLVRMQRRRSKPLVLAAIEGPQQDRRATEPDGPRVIEPAVVIAVSSAGPRERSPSHWTALAAVAGVLVVLLGVGLALRGAAEPRLLGGQPLEGAESLGIAASGAGILDAGGGAEAATETEEPAGAQPEAEVAREPEPMPESVVPRDRPEEQPPRKDGRVRKPKAGGGPRTQPACRDVADAATAANRAKEWRRVIDLTDVSACWPDAAARVRLRVRAFSELGRHAECATLGKTSTDAAVKRIANHCRKQLETESTSP